MSMFPLPDDFFGDIEPMSIFKSLINLDVANTVLDSLAHAGYQAGILGGYARDKFFGIEPKDLDICVAVGNINDAEDIEQIINKVTTIVHKGLAAAGLYPPRKVLGMYNDHASDRACGVIKFHDCNIDVILYRDSFFVEDIIGVFDFNINQFIINAIGDPEYLGNTDLRTLTTVRGDASAERIVKIIRKHSDLSEAIAKAYEEGRL